MMIERVWFKPADGLLVPKEPGLTPGLMFPPQGAWTVLNAYIRRRLREGSGVLVNIDYYPGNKPSKRQLKEAGEPVKPLPAHESSPDIANSVHVIPPRTRSGAGGSRRTRRVIG
ncbi:MAG: DUF2635 domain-containing protein [Anaerolineae bacterium]|nr:DUF2635 domain-containing protein [Anaerolineae bacterium]